MTDRGPNKKATGHTLEEEALDTRGNQARQDGNRGPPVQETGLELTDLGQGAQEAHTIEDTHHIDQGLKVITGKTPGTGPSIEDQHPAVGNQTENRQEANQRKRQGKIDSLLGTTEYWMTRHVVFWTPIAN